MCIRGSYTAPTTGFFLFRVFRVFRGSTPVFRGSIRGSYSLPPSFFFVPFVVPPLYFVVPFVSIRVHSWFILLYFVVPLLFFVVPLLSISVHSWFLLSPLLSYFVPFVFFVVPPLYLTFVSIRVHSWFLLSPFFLFSCLSCFSWFHSCFSWFHSCPFVVLTLPPTFFLRVHSCPFVVPLLYFVVPFVVQSSGVGVFLSYRRWASPLRCQVILTECGRRRAAAPIISGRKVQTPQGRKPG